MAQHRDTLERQLTNAQTALSSYEQRRDADEKKKAVPPKKDPKWRSLDKTRRDLVTRLKRVEQAEQQRAELAAAREGSDG